VNVHRGFIGTRWRNSNYGVPLQSKGGADRRTVNCSCSRKGELPVGNLDDIRKSLAISSCFKLTSPSSSHHSIQRKPPVSVLPQDSSRYKAFQPKPSNKMAPTPIQENLVESNKKYAASFTQGHLALPPAKKYAVCTTPLLSFHPVSLPANLY
jgi:hypothetical protein